MNMLNIIFALFLTTFPTDNYQKGMDLIDQERYEEALVVFDKYEGELQGNALFMKGYCLAHTLKRKEAIQVFVEYLENHQDGPERIRIAAMRWRDILSQPDVPLSPIQEKMEYVARKLRLQQTDETVKIHQKDIVDTLNRMIAESEDQESKSNQQQKNNKKQKQERSSKNNGQGEGSKKGSGSKNPDGNSNKRQYKGDGSDWSKLRDRERDPAFNALKEKFPARYKELVEKYYKSFKK